MKYYVSGSADKRFPVDLVDGVFYLNEDEGLSIPFQIPFQNGWGACNGIVIINAESIHAPQALSVKWVSMNEGKVYEVIEPLPHSDMEELWDVLTANGIPLDHIVVGMAPYGQMALWFWAFQKSYLIAWMMGDEVPCDMPLEYRHYLDNFRQQLLTELHIGNVAQLVPPRDLFDNYMKQFTYRYQVILEHWDEDEEKWIKYDEEKDEVIPEFEYIEESLYDGTHDKLHDGGLMKYHEAGKPKKLALKWHIKKSDYSAYFWFEDEEICAIFNKFYGQHPDTKTDFIIHIDSINKKYELSLYRYGLKEPLIIPESAYQLIAFKSGFENYRSENYNQPTGAWIW